MIQVFGASFATSQAMRTALAEAARTSVRLLGDAGETIAGWVDAVPAPGGLHEQVAVVLELGGNGVPSADAVRAADERLRATNAVRVVWFGYTGWPVDANGVREKRVQTAHVVSRNVREFHALRTPTADEVGRDGVHLTAAGYAKLGREIAQVLGSAPEHSGIPWIGRVAIAGALAVSGWIMYRTIR